MTSLRSPLARARGLGSAKEGVRHWRAQRLTAVALAPLLLWLAASVCAMADAGYEEARAWASHPLVAVLLVSMAVAGFLHLQLGLQVVIEDYVKGEWTRTACAALAKIAAFGLAVAAILSILRIALS